MAAPRRPAGLSGGSAETRRRREGAGGTRLALIGMVAGAKRPPEEQRLRPAGAILSRSVKCVVFRALGLTCVIVFAATPVQ